MKAIVLAGGAGSRLHPLTRVVSKQLLPVFDKPMIYYPLSTLMLAGLKDVLIISTPHDLPMFEKLLGDGSQFGMSFSYAEQPRPEGLAQAFLIGKDFLDGGPGCLILGDNLFYGNQLGDIVRRGAAVEDGAVVFGYRVRDPERYGVVEFDPEGTVISLEEKPSEPKSNYAVPGLYFYGPDVCKRAAELTPSDRGELEITALNRSYLNDGKLSVELFGRGIAWFDTGTHRSLLESANFIASVQERQGLQIGCLEEIAYRNGWIDLDGLAREADSMGKSLYAEYLRELVREESK